MEEAGGQGRDHPSGQFAVASWHDAAFAIFALAISGASGIGSQSIRGPAHERSWGTLQ